MTNAATALTQFRLKPGELLIMEEPGEVTTVLGSCVAITFFSARRGLAAICHAMLPDPGLRAQDAETRPFKYLTLAVPAMIDAFRREHVPLGEIDIKMFGGANVLGQGDPAPNSQSVGPANIRMARLLLSRESLRIRASNVGGRRGRKIVFNTLSGEVFHKHLS